MEVYKIKKCVMISNKNRLYDNVKFITGLSPFRNWENVDSLNKAVCYIRSEYKKTGMTGSEL
jgi:hypothetical protein